MQRFVNYPINSGGGHTLYILPQCVWLWFRWNHCYISLIYVLRDWVFILFFFLNFKFRVNNYIYELIRSEWIHNTQQMHEPVSGNYNKWVSTALWMAFCDITHTHTRNWGGSKNTPYARANPEKRKAWENIFQTHFAITELVVPHITSPFDKTQHRILGAHTLRVLCAESLRGCEITSTERVNHYLPSFLSLNIIRST